MDLKRQVGRRIQEARKGKGLTQAQLAERLGMSKEHISYIETGKRGLGSLDTIEQIADKLGVPPSVLLIGEVEGSSAIDMAYPEISAAWKDPALRRRVLDIFALLTQGPPEFRQALEGLVSLARRSSPESDSQNDHSA